MRASFKSITVSIFCFSVSAALAEDPLVVVAASRAGTVHFFDAALAPMGTIGVNPLLESVSASPDGRRLYIAQEGQMKPGSCCGLFALDLETKKMCFLTEPSLYGAASPDGRFLFTQGARGVEVFDATTLSRLSRMKGPGAYHLQPSPDGRWLLGVTNSPQPSVDVFDMKGGAMARQVPIPNGPATGAWAGNRFYIFNYGIDGEPATGWLWSVNPESSSLPPAKPVALPDLHGGCNEPVLLMLAGSADRLFLAEAFGFKVDRRLACPDAARGGVFVIQPSTGRVGHIAESVHVYRMAVSPDGRDLYVLESTSPSPLSSIRMLHIDTRTGLTMFSTRLGSGEWSLALAHIPPGLIPRGQVRATAGCSR